MSIALKDNYSKNFDISDVFLGNTRLVDSIVKEAISIMSETYVDMIVDEQKSASPKEILEKFQGVNDSAKEYVETMLKDLRTSIIKKFDEVNPEFYVKSIYYETDETINDVFVEVVIDKNT